MSFSRKNHHRFSTKPLNFVAIHISLLCKCHSIFCFLTRLDFQLDERKKRWWSGSVLCHLKWITVLAFKSGSDCEEFRVCNKKNELMRSVYLSIDSTIHSIWSKHSVFDYCTGSKVEIFEKFHFYIIDLNIAS